MTTMRRSGKELGVLLGVFLISAATVSFAETLKPKTVEAWNTYVAATEARIARELESDHGFFALDFSARPDATRTELLRGAVLVTEVKTTSETGKGIRIPGGTIHHWRGIVFIPGANIEPFLYRVMNPSVTGPNQPEVLEKRILEWKPNEFRIYIKMTRKKFITLTYSTEHHVTFCRYGPVRASSRSESTKIAEIANAGTPEEAEKPQGQDRGFMWRLNSYWRYEQVDGGLVVEGESMLLSREIPFLLRPIIEPLIDKSAREMITNTMKETRKNHMAESIAKAATSE